MLNGLIKTTKLGFELKHWQYWFLAVFPLLLQWNVPFYFSGTNEERAAKVLFIFIIPFSIGVVASLRCIRQSNKPYLELPAIILFKLYVWVLVTVALYNMVISPILFLLFINHWH